MEGGKQQQLAGEDDEEDNLMAFSQFQRAIIMFKFCIKVFLMQEGEKILVHPLTESFIELKWR